MSIIVTRRPRPDHLMYMRGGRGCEEFDIVAVQTGRKLNEVSQIIAFRAKFHTYLFCEKLSDYIFRNSNNFFL